MRGFTHIRVRGCRESRGCAEDRGINDGAYYAVKIGKDILLNPIVRKFRYGQHTAVTLETGMMARQATAAVI